MVGFYFCLFYFFSFKPQLSFGKSQSNDALNCSLVEYIEDTILSTSNLHTIQKLHKVLFFDEKSTSSLSLVQKNICSKTNQKQVCCDQNNLESIRSFLSERERIVKGTVSGSVLGLLVDPSLGLVTLQKKRFDDTKKKFSGSNFAPVYLKTNVFLNLIQAQIQSVRQEFQSKSIAQAMEPIFSYFETTLCSLCNPAISKMRVTSGVLKIKQDEKVMKKLRNSYLAANKKYFAAYKELIEKFLSPGGFIDMALLLRNEYYAALLFTLSSHLKDVKYTNTTFLFDHMHSPISLLESFYQESSQHENKHVKPHDFDNKTLSFHSFINEQSTTSIRKSESIEGEISEEKKKALDNNSNLIKTFDHKNILDNYSQDSQFFMKSNVTQTRQKLTQCLKYVNLVPGDLLTKQKSGSFNEHFHQLFDISLNDLTMKRFLMNFLLAPQACLFDIVLNLLQWLPDPRVDSALVTRLTYLEKNPKEFGDDSSLLVKNFKALVRMCESVHAQSRTELLKKDQQLLFSALEDSINDNSSM